MSYRDILVQVDQHPASRARAAAAAHLAHRSKGFVSGVFLKSRFLNDAVGTEALAYMSPDDVAAFLAEHNKSILEASEAAREVFEAEAAQAGVASDWSVIDGDSEWALITAARRADLSVFPPKAAICLSRQTVPAADLGLSCGGPVLVIPPSGCSPALGRRVLVAWNGSREASRALRDAWPLVMAADRVTVLMIAPDEFEGGPDSLLQRHLERHGREADIIVDSGKVGTTAEILRRHVQTLDADLLVMGLYGRPRVQELILGGVSRSLLQDPPVPLFLSH
jgi:nucleotide-binding universal stress UspA family protein